MIIKEIFEKNIDEVAHSAFLKYGRGEYREKFLLESKRQSKGWVIKAGPEFVNDLVRACLEKVSGSVSVKGIIVSTNDLRGDLPFPVEKVSNFQGVRKHIINTEVGSSELREVIGRNPRAFFGLSFGGEGFELKIKAKAPTSGKPGKESEDGPKADFCSLKTNDKNIVNELFFDCGDFAEVRVSHTISVGEIVYPSNMESLSPKEIREKARRKGKIIRKAIIDGKEKVSEVEFVA